MYAITGNVFLELVMFRIPDHFSNKFCLDKISVNN